MNSRAERGSLNIEEGVDLRELGEYLALTLTAVCELQMAPGSRITERIAAYFFWSEYPVRKIEKSSVYRAIKRAQELNLVVEVDRDRKLDADLRPLHDPWYELSESGLGFLQVHQRLNTIVNNALETSVPVYRELLLSRSRAIPAARDLSTRGLTVPPDIGI